MKYTIKTKILIFFLFPIAIAMLFDLWSSYQHQRDVLEDKQVLLFTERSADIKSSVATTAFEIQNEILSFRRNYLTLPNVSNDAVFQIMEKYLESDPDIQCISLSYINQSTKSTDQLFQLQMHRNQNVIEKNVYSDNIVNYTNSPYVQPVNVETIFIWTPAYYDKLRGDTYLISCSYPILKDKQLDAVVTFDIKLENINNIISGIVQKSLGSMIVMTEDMHVIFNSGNTVIAATPENQRRIQTKVLDEKSTAIMDKQISEDKRTGDNRIKKLKLKRFDGADLLVITSVVKEFKWRIFYAITSEHIFQLALKELYPTLILSIGILILLFFILTYIAHKITRPIVKLNRAMKVFSETGNKVEVITALSDEVGELSREFTQMQETIIQRNKDLEKLDVAKSNFLSLISHEIRTPLNGILGSAFFLKEQNEDGEMSEFLDMLTESAERLESLSKKALLITELQSRSGDGKSKTVVVLKEIVMQSLKDFVEIIEKKQLETEVIIDANAKTEVFADAFATAVNELISNSCRFSNKNSTIRIHYKVENGKSELLFINDGPVIDPVRLEQLGKPFELGEAHYDKHTGLGLAVVNTIMEMHGGEMHVSNNGSMGVINRIVF